MIVITPERLEEMSVTFGDPYRAYMAAVSPDGTDPDPWPITSAMLFEAIRLAARQTAWALLGTARDVKVTEAQWEAMRVVAAEVAPD